MNILPCSGEKLLWNMQAWNISNHNDEIKFAIISSVGFKVSPVKKRNFTKGLGFLRDKNIDIE